MRLAKHVARGLEFRRGFGVELEHVVVTRDGHSRADGLGQTGGLTTPQVAVDPPFRATAVYRQ